MGSVSPDFRVTDTPPKNLSREPTLGQQERPSWRVNQNVRSEPILTMRCG